MVDQESPHKLFLVEIAEEVAALLTPKNRAFLAAKCQAFWRRVEDVEARCKEAHEECERLARGLGPRWRYGRGVWVIERPFVLRAPKKWPAVDCDARVAEFCRRVEKVEARRKEANDPFNICRQRWALRWNWGNLSDTTSPNKPTFIHVERQFYLNPTAGDPRHWFPPEAKWWKQPDSKEELPNEQDALLRDCVLVVLIHDLTFPRYKPVYFRPDHICPGGNWWHELLYERTLRDMIYIRDSNSPDVEHFKACIRQSLRNVADACGGQGPLTGRSNREQAGQPGETAGVGDGTRSKKGGRRSLQNVGFWRRVRNTYEEVLATGIGSKGAWSKAAETHGVTSGEAARKQCARYLEKKRNRGQN